MLLETGSLLTAVAALAVVLAIVWVGSRAVRMSGLAPRSAGPRLLAMRDVIALDSRRRLLVVQCGARDLVLLTGGPADVVVGWLDQSYGPPRPRESGDPSGMGSGIRRDDGRAERPWSESGTDE